MVAEKAKKRRVLRERARKRQQRSRGGRRNRSYGRWGDGGRGGGPPGAGRVRAALLGKGGGGKEPRQDWDIALEEEDHVLEKGRLEGFKIIAGEMGFARRGVEG